MSPFFNSIFTYPVETHRMTFKSIEDVFNKRKNDRGIFPGSDTVQMSFDARGLTSLAPWLQAEGGGTASITPVSDCFIPVPNEVVFSFPFVSDQIWQIFADEAFNSFSTQIPTDVSVANFTWELRELGQLLPKLGANVQKTLSGQQLQMEFGWKPLLDDLRKLGGLLSRVNSRIDFLKSTYGKRTRLGAYKGNVAEVSLSSYTQNIQDMRFSYVTHRWELVATRCDLRAGGLLFHTLEDLDTVYSFCRAMTVALGLDNPLKTVWNALPYSFVVDWFLGLSRVLGHLSINPFEGAWQVENFSSSANSFAKWKVSQVVDNVVVANLGYVNARRYERISYLPVSQTILNLQIPSPQQLLLLNAMFAQH